MKRFAAMLAIVGFVTSASFAGTVQFDPASIEVPFDNIPASIPIQVTLVSSEASFDNTNVVIGSNDGLILLGFDYTQEFIDGASFVGTPTATGIYVSDLFVGGFNPDLFNTPFVLGTLNVALPTTVAAAPSVGDEFSLLVDSSIDGFSNIGADSTLLGAATITIVPEPATLCLLGLGAVGLIRRRRFA